jgi:antitoxin VapB
MYIPTYEDAVTQSSVFKSNRSQAVRLPKDVALPDTVKRVDIVKLGKARLITPAGTAWDTFFDAPGSSEDFLADRNQPEQQKRESF